MQARSLTGAAAWCAGAAGAASPRFDTRKHPNTGGDDGQLRDDAQRAAAADPIFGKASTGVILAVIADLIGRRLGGSAADVNASLRSCEHRPPNTQGLRRLHGPR
ncbi:hypothetical protein [Bradyrhizobium sp. USDA 4448]